MADSLYVLNEADLSILQGIIARERMSKTRPPYVHQLPTDSSAPEVYIALTPKNGIPAISGEPGTGSHVLHAESGTGTGFRDYAGQNLCKLYQIGPSDSDPSIIPLGISVYVNNLSNSAISGGIFIPIMRDKSGSWLAVPLALAPAASSSSSPSAVVGAQFYKGSDTTLLGSEGYTYLQWDSTFYNTSDEATNYTVGNGLGGYGTNTMVSSPNSAGATITRGVGVTLHIDPGANAGQFGLKIVASPDGFSSNIKQIAGQTVYSPGSTYPVMLSAYGVCNESSGLTGYYQYMAFVINYTTSTATLRTTGSTSGHSGVGSGTRSKIFLNRLKG